jgi:ABC-2 type transport system permease protein
MLEVLSMQAFRSLFLARLTLLLQYRAAAFAGMMTQLFWGVMKVMVLAAFFRHTTTTQPMTLDEAISYVWLGQAFLMAIVPWSGDREIQELIRSGAVGYDLLRPIDLYNFWLTRALAMRTAPVILRAIPLLTVTMLILPLVGLSEWSLVAPASLAALVAFIVSFAAAVVLSAALTMLLTVSLLWTISGEGMNNIVPTLAIMLSGMVVPLPLFPDWIKPLLNFLPFSGLLDRPLRLFTGNLPPEALWGVLLHQVFWIAVIVGFGRFLVSRGVHKLVIQGG